MARRVQPITLSQFLQALSVQRKKDAVKIIGSFVVIGENIVEMFDIVGRIIQAAFVSPCAGLAFRAFASPEPG